MTSKKRKTLIIILTSAVLLIAAVITVYAYLANSANKKNTFNLGKVGENSANVSQIQETFSSPAVMENSNETTKQVKVTNNSSVPAYARLFVDFSDKKVRDNAKIVVNDPSTQNPITGSPFTWNEFITAAKGTNGINGWKYVDDSTALLGGYFYYTDPIAAGGTTNQLFDKVISIFDDSPAAGLTSADYIEDFDIIVYSEIVQVTETNSDGTVYDSSWEAAHSGQNAWEAAWKSFLKISP